MCPMYTCQWLRERGSYPVTSYHLRSFFFQAEDGIRDDLVTGVQTCALPISDTGIWTRAGWSGEEPRGPAGGNFERRGLHRVEPGEGQADRSEVFGEGFEREAGVQAGAAGSVWIVTGAPEPAADRNRVALRGSKGLRFDRGKIARTHARGSGAGGARNGRAQV